MLSLRNLGLISTLAFVWGCANDTLATGAADDFTPDEWDKIKTLSPLPERPPLNTSNKFGDDERAATMGQKLFFDPAFSGAILVGDDGSNHGLGAVGEAGKVACSSCHSAPWFKDDRPNPIALGIDWFPRNTPSLVNGGYLEGWQDYEGFNDSIWMNATNGAELTVNFSRLEVAHTMFANYRSEYDAIFDEPLDPALGPAASDAARFPAAGMPKPMPDLPDGPWEGMALEDQTIANRVLANYGKAIEAFIRKLNSTNAPFDRFVAGDEAAISSSARRGLKLFIGKAACSECHKGPNFTDEKFHNTTHMEKYPDVTPGNPFAWQFVTENFPKGHEFFINLNLGHPMNRDGEFSDDPNTGLDKGPGVLASFRTPSLRNIAQTAPYMRDGQLATLQDVMDFYNKGGTESGYLGDKDEKMKALNLSDAEIQDIIEFMRTLTGREVDESLTHG